MSYHFSRVAGCGEEQQVPFGRTVPLALADGRHAIALERHHELLPVDRLTRHLPLRLRRKSQLASSSRHTVVGDGSY